MDQDLKFPIISNQQVVLVRCNNIGQVLDANFILHLNDKQEMYTIFDSIDAAKVYINSESKRQGIQFYIYDKDNNFLYESVNVN